MPMPNVAITLRSAGVRRAMRPVHIGGLTFLTSTGSRAVRQQTDVLRAVAQHEAGQRQQHRHRNQTGDQRR